jgi:hypothetical protein
MIKKIKIIQKHFKLEHVSVLLIPSSETKTEICWKLTFIVISAVVGIE